MVKRMMIDTKFDIKKFDVKNDFGLWQVKMKALLEQHGLAAALEELLAATIASFEKNAFSILILCLGDRVLWEITGETNVAGILKNSEPSSLDDWKVSFTQFMAADSQDNPNDEEDTRSIPSYLSPFQPKLLHSSEHKHESRHTKDFEAKYNKVKAKLTLLSSSVSALSSSSGKNKGLIAESYDWDKEEVSSDDNEVPKVKARMALADEKRVNVSKESAKNGEWIKISMKKILVLKQVKLDLLTIHHVNTEILKENQNLKNELKELTSITKAWLNSSNKVNQCISEQIPTQKNKILGIDQLTIDTFSSGPKDLVFIKSSADNLEVSITGSNKSKLSEAEDSTLSNHDTSKHPLPLLEKLTSTEPVSGPKTIKSILKSKSIFKAETLKGITINEASSAPARGNKGSSASKTNSAPAGKLKNVKIEDDPPLAIVMKELNELKLQISKNNSSYFRNKNSQQTYKAAIPFPSCIHYGYNDHKSDDYVYYPICEICGSYDHDTHGYNMIISLRRGIKSRNPQHVTKNYKTCGSSVHTTFDHNDIEWFRKKEALQAKKVESFKASVLTYFLKFQIKQSERGISINEESYVNDPLRMYDKIGSSVNTPIMPHNMLGPDLNGKVVNEPQYKAMSSAEAENVAAVRCCANIL
ncbi:hypothetical protein Tco_0752702 [Tanacetum coccineum]|uniref:Uncharacterized protein n=1 Tax=Tanacetum coccineum TaxID=301880 RepID=A0ABQ4ZA84_9ASTR